MGDSKKEKEIFCKMLDCNKVVGNTALSLHNCLRDVKKSINYETEKPDMVIKEDDLIIGIEHCMIDVLFKKKRKMEQSLTRVQEGIIKKAVDKYKENAVLLEVDIKNGTAPMIIQNCIEDGFNYRGKFCYSDFVEYFKRVTGEHNSKVDIYKDNLEKYAKKANILACLIEVQCPKEKAYKIVTMNGKVSRQRIIGIPITGDLIQAISKMTGFDFVILYLHEECGKDRVYYFVPSRMKSCIREQHISIFQAFDFTLKCSMKITGESQPGEYKMNMEIDMRRKKIL